MASKLILKKSDHAEIQKQINLQGEEEYSVVTHKIHGEWKRSIHVFSRLPTTLELTNYENSASKVKFKGGGKAEVEGGAVKASVQLYNTLIHRVYDLPIGTRVFGEGTPLNEKDSRDRVPPLVKREALRDFLGEVYSESRLSEREGEDEEVNPSEDD